MRKLRRAEELLEMEEFIKALTAFGDVMSKNSALIREMHEELLSHEQNFAREMIAHEIHES